SQVAAAVFGDGTFFFVLLAAATALVLFLAANTAYNGFPLPLLGLVHTSIEITRRRRLPATGESEITVYVDQLTQAHRDRLDRLPGLA
ncbi:hypothetical protein, partial [Streptomyces sp. SP17KL33]|uniref:hypothetical protein n=1 Tax=Streptomyces sp. SP17KL33 TaxID=3002534 RepID=UPI002E75C44D